GADVLVTEVGADVAGALEAERVQEAPLDDRAAEAVVVGDGPGGQIAAVGAAHDAQLPRAQPAVGLRRPAPGVAHVLEVHGPEGPSYRATVGSSIPGRTAGVAVGGRVPGRHQRLDLVEDTDAVGRVGTAVDHQDCREGALAVRGREPAVDGISAA